MPSQLQWVQSTQGHPMEHQGAQYLSQHARHECCSPWPSNPPKTGPFFTCLEARQPSAHPAQGHPQSQHPAWPGLARPSARCRSLQKQIQEPHISPWKVPPAPQLLQQTQVLQRAHACQARGDSCCCVEPQAPQLHPAWPCCVPATTTPMEAGGSGQCHRPNVMSKGSPREGQGLWGCLLRL